MQDRHPLVEYLHTRARTTPNLVAIRFGDTAVTFAELGDRISDYDPVAYAHGLSCTAALTAALAALCGPQVSPGVLAHRITAAMTWLARELPVLSESEAAG